MLASVKVMDALKGIGLNLYERRLWVAILTRGTSTAGELSEIANVPRSRTYDVLQSLADKGFVVIQTGKPIKYVAIPPEEALERARNTLEEEIRKIQKRIEELKDSPVMKELNELHQKGMKIISPEEMTGALKGYSVYQQLDTMFKEANKKIAIVTTPEGLNELFENHLDSLKRAKERGVNIKIATKATDRNINAIKVFSNIADIRSINEKEVPASGRFFLVDDKQLVFPLTDASKVHSSQHMAVWSKSEYAAGDILAPLFKLIWSHSKELK